MRIVIDTNVVIDALTGREPFNADAEKLFILAANQMVDMFVTASAATDIYCLIRKHLHSTEQAKNVMEKLYELLGILDVTESDCTNALISNMKDYEDAVVTECAHRNKIDYIITRNIKDYKDSKVQVIMPDEFINMWTETEE